MLISDRQRLVAETGLLTLLGWMAVTIAFDRPPRQSSAGDLLQLDLLPAPNAELRMDDTRHHPDPPRHSTAASTLPPELAPLSALIAEPKIALPPAPTPLPSGTVIRMGEGVHVHPEPRMPTECLHRSATGARQIGPEP